MGFTQQNYRKPFVVECAKDSNKKDKPVDTPFATLDEAYDFIDRVKSRFTCIYLWEIGSHIPPQSGESWFCFWWSPATGWGEVAGRGIGYDMNEMNALVPYRSYKEV